MGASQDRTVCVFGNDRFPSQRSPENSHLQLTRHAWRTKKKTGGRIPALEIMTGTTAIRNLIREGKIHQIPGTMQVSQKDGMQTMDMALQSLVTRDLVTKEEAQSKSMTANLFGPSAVGGAARR